MTGCATCNVHWAKYWNVGNEFNRINHMIFEMCWFSTTVHKKKLMHIRCNCSRFGWFCFGFDCLLQFYTIYIGYYPESLSVLDSIPKISLTLQNTAASIFQLLEYRHVNASGILTVSWKFNLTNFVESIVSESENSIFKMN